MQKTPSGNQVNALRDVRKTLGLFGKRLLDICISIVGLIVLSPFLAIIALIIKFTSPGPVFFIWNVVGKNGKPFTSYKFRTMVQTAEGMEKDLSKQNEMQGVYFKIKDDSRITRIGKILRKYSLDELPTLVSVLKGDMSLVGPRPARIHEFEEFAEWHKKRLAMVPGVTGLWQVSGKNDITNFDEIVKIDIWYIENWSLWFDLKILLKTIPVVIFGGNY